MKVAIIGAGVAGLASAKQALNYNLDFVVFEKTDHIGGVWMYDDNPPTKPLDSLCQSPVYENLRTNLPKQLMEFRDFNFEPKSGLCFPYHEEVLDYINNFTERCKLRKHIQFLKEVTSVSKCDEGWHLVVKNLKTISEEDYFVEAVMICNGHYTKPYIPAITGLETFVGNLIHSHCYRNNECYKDKIVLVVGNGPSGKDISTECSLVAAKVIVSGNHENDNCGHCVKKIISKSRFSFVDKDKAYFDDGSSVKVDAIILCTGYRYYFPFLDDSCGICMEGGKIVKPLYKFLINITHPSMCFIGLKQKTFVFQLCDIEAEIFIKYLKGLVQRPRKEEMLNWLNEQSQKKLEAKESASMYFYLGNFVETHLNELCKFGAVEQLPPVLFKIYRSNTLGNEIDYQGQKNRMYEIIDFETYRVQPDDECMMANAIKQNDLLV